MIFTQAHRKRHTDSPVSAEVVGVETDEQSEASGTLATPASTCLACLLKD